MLVGTNFSKNIFQQTSLYVLWFDLNFTPILNTAEKKKWFLSLHMLDKYNSCSNLTIVHFQGNPPAGEWIKSTREILRSAAVTIVSTAEAWAKTFLKAFQSYFIATTQPNVDKKKKFCDSYLHDTYGFSWKVIRCVREES